MEGGCHTAYTDNHYNSDLFSVICEEFYRRGSVMAPFEIAIVVSYRLSIVTIVLSVTIRPQFAIECLRRSNQQGVGHGPKFPGVPLGVDP